MCFVPLKSFMNHYVMAPGMATHGSGQVDETFVFIWLKV